MPIHAEGWFLPVGAEGDGPGALVRDRFELPGLRADEVLVEPLYGCWEANMTHALERSPIDVCAFSGKQRAILGNAGVVRVLEVGADVRDLAPGRACLIFCFEADRWGYPLRIMGYDSPKDGLLATRIVLKPADLLPLPEDTRHSLARWAAFNNRYVTAWANWRVAHGTFRLLLEEHEFERLNVWTWGGGTGLAEVQLAARLGHAGVALTSRADRLAFLEAEGVRGVDRTPFLDLDHDERRYATDAAYAERYRAAEARFLETVHELTGGEGVQIFVDQIGTPVFRATVKALGRHGVLTTVGWKEGMSLRYLRARESIARHQFVHTHLARRSEAEAAIEYGERTGWMPTVDERVYTFDEIPELAQDYAAGRFRMFPVYSINPE